ncbi:alpha/beta hydrolase fold domain-containing protein [Chryseobacterium sp. CT-SW4]|uniref:alpha/beta hydrolase fold domain-containing protein n=1 Tax=Chryseobacterium sp. SW-1 TaxID=3157343 RepID=UPI003B016CE0
MNTNENPDYESQLNILYGDHIEQKMDLYTPKNQSNIKKDIFIIVHGGGWNKDDKKELTSFTLELIRKFPNHIFANINYRLANHNRFGFPNQMEDVHSALDYLESRLNYKPRFIILGNSAGANISMMYSYKYDMDKRIKAVINIVGISNLSDPEFKKYEDYAFVEKYLVDSAVIPENQSAMDFASPITWISRNSPPTFSFYGTTDDIVPLSQKEFLDTALQSHNVLNESYTFVGGHVDWEYGEHAPFLLSKISEFLNRLRLQ